MGFLGFRRMSLMRGSKPPNLQHLRSKSLQPPAKRSQESAPRPREELEELEVYCSRVTFAQALIERLCALFSCGLFFFFVLLLSVLTRVGTEVFFGEDYVCVRV